MRIADHPPLKAQLLQPGAMIDSVCHQLRTTRIRLLPTSQLPVTDSGTVIPSSLSDSAIMLSWRDKLNLTEEIVVVFKFFCDESHDSTNEKRKPGDLPFEPRSFVVGGMFGDCASWSKVESGWARKNELQLD
jgi:hypothetical protein